MKCPPMLLRQVWVTNRKREDEDLSEQVGGQYEGDWTDME